MRTRIALRARSRRELAKLEAWQPSFELDQGGAIDWYDLCVKLAARAGIRARLVIEQADQRFMARVSHQVDDGLGNVHLSRGALAAFERAPDPLMAGATVIGHELGHLAAGDIGRMRAPVFALVLGALLVLAASVLAVLSGAWWLLGLAIVAEPTLLVIAVLRAAYGERRAEFCADDYAVALTGAAIPLAAVLEGVSDPPPIGGWRQTGAALLSEHPSSAVRAARLRHRFGATR